MTTQKSYTIKDAAQKVNVETHVLRYWEEELGLKVERNGQGHRCYTEEDIELLQKIRDWKEQGLQLKAIRIMLSGDGKLAVPQEVVRQAQDMAAKQPIAAAEASVEEILLDDRTSKAAKLQLLLENLVSRAVQENSETIMKELDYQFRQLEENAQEREKSRMAREEEHYKKLDELLCQRGRRRDKRKKRPKATL